MFPPWWDGLGLFIAAATLLHALIGKKPNSTGSRRKRVVTREREIRLGRWFVWRVRDRDEDSSTS